MARILVGGILQETNTYSPLKETYDSFQQYRGEALLNYPHTSPAKLIQEAGHTAVPAVYASIIPSGPLEAAEYERFVEDFLSYCTDGIDGIWLSMHGAMTVSGTGSAEAYLLKRLRERYGESMPIFGSFDFHANMNRELVSRINYITGYYTAPHVDIYETGCRAVRALIACVEGAPLPHSQYIPIPMVMPGELVITSDWPASYFQEKLRALERETGIEALSLFCGFAWSDCPRNRMAITVSASRASDAALEKVKSLASELWAMRAGFSYGEAKAMDPRAAVEFAASSGLPKIMLSDTGDNITAGCAGDQALLAGLMIDAGLQNALVAGLADRPAVDECFAHELGDSLTLTIGGTIDPEHSARIQAAGTLLHKRTFDAEELSTPLRIAVLRVGGVDLLLTSQRYSVISRKRINDTGLRYDDYRIIAVKLGYLFPDFAAQRPCSILALTPGNAYQDTARISYTNGPPRYYPRDDFPFSPEFEGEEQG